VPPKQVAHHIINSQQGQDEQLGFREQSLAIYQRYVEIDSASQNNTLQDVRHLYLLLETI
jgi:hypothetical protein